MVAPSDHTRRRGEDRRVEARPFPRLETERLVLRGFTATDAPEVRRLAGEREIAATTLNIPHPYPEGLAEEWIGGHAAAWAEQRSLSLLVERKEDAAVAGGIGLALELGHERAELGYWIATPYWGCGYATEAAASVVRYSFEELGLNRVFAHHFTSNPASGRVLEKIGMRSEGRRRQHTLKWGEFLDSDVYAILRSEYEAAAAQAK